MARPCKSANVLSECSQTKEEINNRIELENKLKGGSEKLIPPDHLNENQKNIFNYIKSELEESKILGNLDSFILTKCSIAIDRLEFLEKKINEKPSLLLNQKFMANKKSYDADFFRCCNELSLSPQSRAKLGNINMLAEERKEDPIYQILGG